MGRFTKTLGAILAVTLLLLLSAAAAYAAVLPQYGSFFTVKSREAEPISEGVTLYDYALDVSGSQVKLAVLEVDLSNPYLQLEIILGANGTLDGVQQVTRMAERTGAVAAVNSGFFIMGQGKPLGIVARDGELIASPIMRDDMPAFALTVDKTPIMEFFQYDGWVTASNGERFHLYGVNKLAYNMEDRSMSDINKLNLYNRNWGLYSRGGVDELFPWVTETIVVNDVVVDQITGGEPQPIPAGGYVLWGQADAADFMVENMPIGSKVQVKYQTVPDFSNLKLSTGSNSFLVQYGAVSAFQEELRGKNSRTAVGVSQNGKTLYLVAVEHSYHSRGLEQYELAALMVALGSETALNLDGGGSTTMVAKRVGESNLSSIVQPKEGRERAVTDAIGIFNTAPKGTPMGIFISGPSWVLAGTENSYSYKGYDSHYYPWQPGTVQWEARGGGSVTGGVFKAGSGGDVVLEATSGEAKGTKNVHVVGASEIKGLNATPASIMLTEAAPVALNFSVQTYDGGEFPLEARYLTLQSDCGTVNDGVFTPYDDKSRGKITAVYQGLALDIPVRSGSLFSDAEGHWAEEQINELADAGIVNGFDDGTYHPDDQVTRAEMVTLLARLTGWPAWENAVIFSDSIPAWAAGSVNAAVARGVVTGYPDNTFKPGNPVTRAEAAVILDKALNLPYAVASTNFNDAGQIPAWAADSLNRVVAAGLMRGYDDYTVRPGASLTRAEIAVLLKRVRDADLIKAEYTPPPILPVAEDEPPVDERTTQELEQPPDNQTEYGTGVKDDNPAEQPSASDNPMRGGLRPVE